MKVARTKQATETNQYATCRRARLFAFSAEESVFKNPIENRTEIRITYQTTLPKPCLRKIASAGRMKNTGTNGLDAPPVSAVNQNTTMMSARNATNRAAEDRIEGTPRSPRSGFHRVEYGSENSSAPVVKSENPTTIHGIPREIRVSQNSFASSPPCKTKAATESMHPIENWAISAAAAMFTAVTC
jgi:hypothetical protein